MAGGSVCINARPRACRRRSVHTYSRLRVGLEPSVVRTPRLQRVGAFAPGPSRLGAPHASSIVGCTIVPHHGGMACLRQLHTHLYQARGAGADADVDRAGELQ